MSKTSDQIRREFIEFFQARGHTFVRSSSLLPAEDPTLLFTNAGMNQFKDVFLGTGTRPYRRAVNSQKCIRAGGKHNDLEDVGHDTYHHTFFEMLGNWSFGDYFKTEAIKWAWELLTDVWNLPKDKLWASVFGGDETLNLAPDEQSEKLWPEITDIPPERVLRGSIKDNFWEMGETGPCGPCTEIHIDLGEDKCDGSTHPGIRCGVSVEGCRRFIELWNLVFIQFNRDESGALVPLAARHVDTGMGLERICALLQGVSDNYATDLFAPLIRWIEQASNVRYGQSTQVDTAIRVIADHARACTFAITDGIIPSNEGRGYVIRRILRRAARFGRKINQHEPFIYKLVPVIAEKMGSFFPELIEQQQRVMQCILDEEQSFNKTLDRGLEIFESAVQKVLQQGSKRLSGETVFELYATYGFPVDLTQLMADERGLSVDMEGYEREMARHREISSAGGSTFQVPSITDLPRTDDKEKYTRNSIKARVIGWIVDNSFIDTGELPPDSKAGVVLDRTNFYGERGGQLGDTGSLIWPGGQFRVEDTQIIGHCIVHIGQVQNSPLKVGTEVIARYDADRRMNIMRNHTATHLLNWALREVLGGHVNQAGSVVAPDRLRFDFTHDKALSHEELLEVETLVNEAILADETVITRVLPKADAEKIPGIRKVFDEKYPDPVRVVVIGAEDFDNNPERARTIEFCGGTHLERTSQVGFFKIVSEESVARGIRRITAVTGQQAVRYVQELDESARSAAAILRVPIEELPRRLEALQQEVKRLKKSASSTGTDSAGLEKLVNDAEQIGQVKLIIGQVEASSAEQMRLIVDKLRQKAKAPAAVLIGSRADGKVLLVAGISEELVKTSNIHAGDWIKVAAQVVGGGGGGKPTMAQAGGRDMQALPEALDKARKWIKDKLG